MSRSISPRRWGTTRITRRSRVKSGGSGWLSTPCGTLKLPSRTFKLDRIGSGLTINAVASVMLAMYQAMAEKRGFDLTRISATPAERHPQRDDRPRGMDLSGRGCGPPDRRHDRVFHHHASRCNPVSVCGYHMRESGANPAQEIGFALEIANTYIDEAIRRGLSVDDVARRITFNFNIFGNLWEQVGEVPGCSQALGQEPQREVRRERPAMPCTSEGSSAAEDSGLTKAQPENNIMRARITPWPRPWQVRRPQRSARSTRHSPFRLRRAALLSLRTCELLMDEIGLRDTVDPLAGSYFIETLTKQMEEKIQEERKKIQDVGGMVEPRSPRGFVAEARGEAGVRVGTRAQDGEYREDRGQQVRDETEIPRWTCTNTTRNSRKQIRGLRRSQGGAERRQKSHAPSTNCKEPPGPRRTSCLHWSIAARHTARWAKWPTCSDRCSANLENRAFFDRRSGGKLFGYVPFSYAGQSLLPCHCEE